MSRGRYCGNDGCDGGFVWVSDRWARHTVGIGQDDSVADVSPEKWAEYRAAANSVYLCSTCGGAGSRTAADRFDPL